MRPLHYLLLLVAACPAPGQAPVELLQNGGAEAPPCQGEGEAAGETVPDWRTPGGDVTVRPSGWKGLKAWEGEHFFWCDGGAPARLRQVVELPEDPGVLVLAARCLGTASGSRRELVLETLDAGGKVLRRAGSGTFAGTDWVRHLVAVPVPAGVRRARVTLAAFPYAAAHSASGFDAVSLRLLKPRRGVSGETLALELRAAGTVERLEEAAFALALRGGAWGWEVLRAELRGCKQPERRAVLLRALAGCGDPRIRKLLLQLLRKPGEPGDRRVALGVLPRVSPAWRTTLRDWVEDTTVAGGLRELALEALLHPGGSKALEEAMALCAAGDARMKVRVLLAAGHVLPVAALYSSLLAPNLGADADPAVRQQALRILAEEQDPRFFRHVKYLMTVDDSQARRGQWVRWGLEYDSVRALRAVVPLVLSGTGGTRSTFLRRAPGLKDPGVTRWFREEGVASPDRVVRLAALRHLERRSEKEPAVLGRLARDPDPTVGREALRALAGSPAPEADQVLRDLVSTADGERAALALAALWRRWGGSPEAVELCRDLAAMSRTPELRTAALDLLKAGHAAEAREEIVANLEHPRPRVRLAAFDALTFLRRKSSVDLLLQRLEQERGIMRYHVASCLYDLTRRDWGADLEAWTSWWGRVREGFELPPKPPTRPQVRGHGYDRYYGIDVRAEHVVFLVDVSGSMGAGTAGGTRLEVAKKKLLEVLKGFTSRRSFNVVAFDEGVQAWSPHLRKARKSAIAEASSWVRSLRPAGSTNIYDSLMFALEDDGVESIFLLSDGAPTAGLVVDPGEIRRAVAEHNRVRRVRIHTIAVGEDARSREFLRRLAEENRGDFVEAGP